MGKAHWQRLIARGFQLLLEAYLYAEDCHASVWDFAVEIGQLRSLGLSENEFRWLVVKGYVEHGLDTTLCGDEQRTFHHVGGLRFGKKSCFILTTRGVEAAKSMTCETPASPDPDSSRESCCSPQVAASGSGNATPFWDSERHELWLGRQLIKQFKRHARNQEAILSAFQEEGWPAHIDDPLSPEGDIDTKRRLNDTIKSLNRHQKSHRLRFAGDGSSEGVIWERVDEDGRPMCERP